MFCAYTTHPALASVSHKGGSTLMITTKSRLPVASHKTVQVRFVPTAVLTGVEHGSTLLRRLTVLARVEGVHALSTETPPNLPPGPVAIGVSFDSGDTWTYPDHTTAALNPDRQPGMGSGGSSTLDMWHALNDYTTPWKHLNPSPGARTVALDSRRGFSPSLRCAVTLKHRCVVPCGAVWVVPDW